jgi:hypothetical protein
MSKVTKAQIEEWKKKHGRVFMLESGGKVAYIYDPTTDLRVMKAFITAQSEERIKGVEVIFKNCWLEGDQSIRDSEECLMDVADQLSKLVDIPDFDIEDKGDHFLITIDGSTCQIRPVTRGDIKYGEDRNRNGVPFQSSIHVLERVGYEDNGKGKAFPGIEEMKADNRKYLSLILAIRECKKKEYVAIKEL